MKKVRTRTYFLKRSAVFKLLIYIALIVSFLYIVVVQKDTLSQSLSSIFLENEITCKNYLNNTIAFTNLLESETFMDKIEAFSEKFLGFSINSPLAFIDSQIAFAAQYDKSKLAQPESKTIDDASEEKSEQNTQIVPAAVTNETVKTNGKTITNHTSYEVDENTLMNQELKFNKNNGNNENYEVLILHTHATESYMPNDRNDNDDLNVVKVGEVITQRLNEQGIKTLHLTTHHDQPSYNGSYKKSAESVQQYLGQYPEIQVVLDIHRDAIQASDGGKLSLVTQIKNQRAAQAMLVVGTDNGGLEHPNWKNNLSFALKLQNVLMGDYPNLMRTIDLRKERFNQNLSDKYIIIEIGSNGNELSDAINSAGYIADGVAKLIKTNTK